MVGQNRGTQRHRPRKVDGDRELFLSLPEARVVLDQWRIDYNHRRPHGGLKWTTPAAFVAGLEYGLRGVPGGVA